MWKRDGYNTPALTFSNVKGKTRGGKIKYKKKVSKGICISHKLCVFVEDIFPKLTFNEKIERN